MANVDLEDKAISLLSTTTISDFSSETQTTLYTVPTGKVLIISHAYIEADDDVGAAGVITIGRSTALTDFVNTTNLDNLDADGDVILVAPVPSATPTTIKTYAAATIIQIDVATAGNAVGGTVYLFGFLYDA